MVELDAAAVCSILARVPIGPLFGALLLRGFVLPILARGSIVPGAVVSATWSGFLLGLAFRWGVGDAFMLAWYLEPRRLRGSAGDRRAPTIKGDLEIAERIKSDVATAMKAGDRDRVGALRLVLSELQKAAKEGDADEQAVLRRERKRRRESEGAYREAGRTELADAEAYEAEVIDAYLPAELGDDELDALVARAIEETGASQPRDMGKAIKHVMAAAGGRADGRRVSTKVKEALG